MYKKNCQNVIAALLVSLGPGWCVTRSRFVCHSAQVCQHFNYKPLLPVFNHLAVKVYSAHKRVVPRGTGHVNFCRETSWPCGVGQEERLHLRIWWTSVLELHRCLSLQVDCDCTSCRKLAFRG